MLFNLEPYKNFPGACYNSGPRLTWCNAPIWAKWWFDTRQLILELFVTNSSRRRFQLHIERSNPPTYEPFGSHVLATFSTEGAISSRIADILLEVLWAQSQVFVFCVEIQWRIGHTYSDSSSLEWRQSWSGILIRLLF